MSLCVLKEANGSQWVLMGPYASLTVFMYSYASMWIPMSLYWSVYVVDHPYKFQLVRMCPCSFLCILMDSNVS